jgi:hypothetical protein
MGLTKRLVKGRPLTFAEGDANLDYLESLSSSSSISLVAITEGDEDNRSHITTL